jgi:hypothetical protein
MGHCKKDEGQLERRVVAMRNQNGIARGTSWKWWALILGGAAVACLICAVITRCSFTDYSNNTDAFNKLPYVTYPYQEADLQTDDDGLINQATLIAVCDFEGQREYQSYAFLSTVDVTQVIKGDGSLANTKIQVYEPRSITQSNSAHWVDHSAEQDFRKKFNIQANEYNEIFPTTGTRQSIENLMSSGNTYVLFLQPADNQSNSKGEAYIPVDNTYSVICTSIKADASTYVAPPAYISVGEEQQYGVLLADASLVDVYNQKVQELFSAINYNGS